MFQLAHGLRGPGEEYGGCGAAPTNYFLSRDSISPSLRLDLVERATVAEVFLLRLGPAAEILDGHEVELGEQIRMLRRNLRIARPVVVARRDFLSVGRVQVLQVFLGDGARATAQYDFVDHGNRG